MTVAVDLCTPGDYRLQLTGAGRAGYTSSHLLVQSGDLALTTL